MENAIKLRWRRLSSGWAKTALSTSELEGAAWKLPTFGLVSEVSSRYAIKPSCVFPALAVAPVSAQTRCKTDLGKRVKIGLT